MPDLCHVCNIDNVRIVVSVHYSLFTIGDHLVLPIEIYCYIYIVKQ